MCHRPLKSTACFWLYLLAAQLRMCCRRVGSTPLHVLPGDQLPLRAIKQPKQLPATIHHSPLRCWQSIMDRVPAVSQRIVVEGLPQPAQLQLKELPISHACPSTSVTPQPCCIAQGRDLGTGPQACTGPHGRTRCAALGAASSAAGRAHSTCAHQEQSASSEQSEQSAS